MRQIEIDDEVFAYLQSQAIAFVENPNDTLRRVLKLENKSRGEDDSKVNIKVSTTRTRNGKRAKTNLQCLVTAKFLKDGQKVILQDYRGNTYPNYEARISGKKLVRNGKSYSMSELAKDCLKELGHSSDSVRGPAFWMTDDGVTIQALWDRYLDD